MPKAHQPSEEFRKQVEAATGIGLTAEQVGIILDIDEKTLRKYYRKELDSGAFKATANVARNLYRMATGTGREAAACAMFWMKCRAGWSEYAPPPAPKLEKLGKKEQQQRDAMSGEQGTPWHGLVN